MHGRLVPVNPRAKKQKYSPATRSKTSASPTSMVTPCSLPRRRLAITPITTSSSPTLSTALSFPPLLPKLEKRLLAARQTVKTSIIVSNIDNLYRIAGAMIQRLCGDEYRIYYDSGRLYSTKIHGFLRIFQRTEGTKVRIASDETCELILTGSYDISRIIYKMHLKITLGLHEISLSPTFILFNVQQPTII